MIDKFPTVIHFLSDDLRAKFVELDLPRGIKIATEAYYEYLLPSDNRTYHKTGMRVKMSLERINALIKVNLLKVEI